MSSLLTRLDVLPPVLVASHPRSGTHLVMDLLRRHFRSLDSWRLWGLPLDHLYLNIERLGAKERQFSETLALRIVNRPRRALMKTHFDAKFLVSWCEDESVPPPESWLEVISQANTVYVIRHPMDVMTSYHQFLSGIDKDIAELDFASFIKSPHWDRKASRLEWWAQHAIDWADKEGVTVLRYEDVVEHTDDIISHIAAWLGETRVGRVPLLPPKLTSKAQTRLDRMTRLSPSSTAIVADRKSFPTTDWRKHLRPKDMGWIEDRIYPMLERFCYRLDPKNPVTDYLSTCSNLY